MSDCLPAIRTAAKVPLAVATTTAAARTPRATTTALAAHRPGLVDDEVTALEGLAIARLDGSLGRTLISDFDEAEAARFTAEFVAHHIDAVDGKSGVSEETLDVGLGGRVG
jgi:hypothetical protein